MPQLVKDATEKCAQLFSVLQVLAHSIENGMHMEESRQLLSYSLIHPAITADERAHFTLWLSHLEERCPAPSAPAPAPSQYPHKTPLQDLNTNITALSYPLSDGKGDASGGYGAAPGSGIGVSQQAAPTRGSSAPAGAAGAWTHTADPAVGGASAGRAITANGSAGAAMPVNGALPHDHVALHMTHSGPAAYHHNSAQPPLPPASQHNHG